MSSRDDILKAFDRINVWSRGSERAPHKPLLVLYALGRLARGEPNAIAFRDVAPKLAVAVQRMKLALRDLGRLIIWRHGF
jgi:hypothetical protein